jgi:hypothetical protein
LKELMGFQNSHTRVHLRNTSFKPLMRAEKEAFDTHSTE